MTDANLAICERSQWQDQMSQCQRILGELDSDAGHHPSAQVHFSTALQLARGIQDLAVLIEIPWAKGLWLAKYHTDLQAQGLADLDEAFSLLNEALGYCVTSGYKLYEADVRVALAWGYLAREHLAEARQEAQVARRIGEETGYHLAVVDADEVLARLSV